MISHFDIIDVRVCITLWCHIRYHNDLLWLYDITYDIIIMCYHSLILIFILWYHMWCHVWYFVYIKWWSASSHVMSCVISQCDVAIMWYNRKTFWHHIWNPRKPRGSSNVMSHSFSIPYVTSHVTSQLMWYHMYITCTMWYHIRHHTTDIRVIPHLISHHHHASLLKSSTKLVVCFGAWDLISHVIFVISDHCEITCDIKPLSPAQALGPPSP